jgi:hypothetical protein
MSVITKYDELVFIDAKTRILTWRVNLGTCGGATPASRAVVSLGRKTGGQKLR